MPLIAKLRSAFFSVGPARRALASVRPPHYTLSGALRGQAAPPIEDLPRSTVEQINRRSDDYFDAPDRHDSWLAKPLSELYAGPDNLWRFGLLLSALQIRPEDRVLDLGCGTGWTSALMATIGAEVTGIDISERAIAIAGKGCTSGAGDGAGARLRFRAYDGFTIDAPDAYFDFAVIFDALHHLPNQVAILTEIFRVLGPHGCVGFAEPGLGHSRTLTAQQEASRGILEGEIDPEQLRRTARDIGFEELDLIVPPVVPRILTLPMPRARWYLRGMPWIVPHDYIRAAILASPIGVIRKSPYASTSLHPHTLRAVVTPEADERSAAPGAHVTIRARVRNTAGTVWLREGRRGVGAVRLGARLDPPVPAGDAGSCVFTPIPSDMRETEECALTLVLAAPGAPGAYDIRLDMHTAGIGWFSDRGSPEARVRLLVRQP